MGKPYDATKNKENIDKHGISFDDVDLFEWESAITKQDIRQDYQESRFISLGFVESRLHALVWTLRNGNIRPISFRKANARERRRYEKDRSTHTLN